MSNSEPPNHGLVSDPDDHTGAGNVAPLRPGIVAARPARVPPHNLEAEQGLLGAILVNNAAYERVSEFLEAEHFGDAVHGSIYGACGRLIERGQIANPVTLKGLFDQDGVLAESGGAKYLIDLANSVVSVVNAVDYAHTIHDLYLRRQLIDLGEDTVNEAYRFDIDVSATAQIESAEQRLFNLAENGQSDGGFTKLVDATKIAVEMAEAAFKRSSPVTGVTSGLKDLDKKLGGLHPSDLIILAGRPSMGKPALETNIGYNAAKAYLRNPEEGGRTAFFSLEMSAEQLANRILAEESGVSSDKIRRGEVEQDDFLRFVDVVREMEAVPFHIDDTPALSVPALRSRARRLKRTQGLDLIIIDYLQLLTAAGADRSENRVQEISSITRGLKALAKELDVPVIALSQLSRQVEQREDKRPQLSDLRESGSIEQDADVVMFVFREQYYLERSEPKQKPEEADDKYNERFERWRERCEEAHNIAEVNIAKQRHGPIGTIALFFDGNITRFADLARDVEIPE